VTYYLATAFEPSDFFGCPAPAAGARVAFDPERLFVAREQLLGQPVERRVSSDDGLVVHEDPRSFDLAARLWRVDDLQGAVRVMPGNKCCAARRSR